MSVLERLSKLTSQFERIEKYEKKYITTLTSMSDFEKYSNTSTIQNKDTYNDVDNELLQECYDVLPCNNITKATSTGFFGWK